MENKMKTYEQIRNDAHILTEKIIEDYEGLSLKFTIRSLIFDALNDSACFDHSEVVYNNLLKKWSK